MFLAAVLVSFVVLQTSCPVQSSNILGVFWTPSRSHHILGSALLQALAKKGHNVTLLSPFADDVEIPTFKQVKLDGIIGLWDRMIEPKISLLKQFYYLAATINESIELFWKNAAVRDLIYGEQKYDVIIMIQFYTDGILALLHPLDAPIILFYPSASNPLANSYVANPELACFNQISYDPESFSGRLKTTTMTFFSKLYENWIAQRFQQNFVDKEVSAPPISTLHRNVSLVFVNSHFSTEPPRPYVPNMVPIGGFYAASVKPLPKELQQYLDEAKNGAVLLSFGTNMKIKNIDKDKLDAMLSVLAKIAPMKVVFKSEIPLNEVPKNVLVQEWLPQNDILAHPNMKAFITHGGLGGVTEAVYHGVPMVGIPLFADQKTNIEIAKKAGYAVPLDYEEITATSFEKALMEVLNDPRFTENAKKRSKLLRNQPIDPLKKAIWWVEHIIEFKGGEHLRNVAMDLEWYQIYMVDIILFYFIVLFVMMVLSFYITRFILRRIVRRFSKKVKTN